MLTILKKELIDCFRDRRTLLLTVLLPIILMSGLVFFYEGLMNHGKDETYTIAVQKGTLETAEAVFADNTLVFKEVQNVEMAITDSDAEAGLVLPANFIEMLQNEEIPQLQIVADAYSQNGSFAANKLEIGLAAFSQQHVLQALSAENIDPSILQPFTIEHIQTVEGDNSIMMVSFLIPLMLSVAIGVGAGPAALDLFAGEKERKTMEALLMTPVKRSALLFAKWMTLAIIASITGVITLLVVSLEIYFFTENLKAGLQFDGKFPGIAAASFIIIISYGALMAAILLLVSLFAKTIKEAQSYSTPFQIIAVVPAMYVINMGVNELAITHFIVPILSLFAIFKELLLGIIDYSHIFMVVGGNLVVVVILLLLARLFFLKDRWVMTN